jgi:hypothetical protein
VSVALSQVNSKQSRTQNNTTRSHRASEAETTKGRCAAYARRPRRKHLTHARRRSTGCAAACATPDHGARLSWPRARLAPWPGDAQGACSAGPPVERSPSVPRCLGVVPSS